MTGRIWIDVEDIFIFASAGRTPTGIQRLSFELCRALHENYGKDGDIRLLRRSRTPGSFVETSWDSLDSLFGQLAAAAVAEASVPLPLPEPAPAVGWRDVVRPLLRPLLGWIPDRLRQPLVTFLRMQARAIYALVDLGVAVIRTLLAPIGRLLRGGHAVAPLAAAAVEDEPPAPDPDYGPAWAPRQGDVLFIPGAAWYHADYAVILAAAQEHGVRAAVLLYDIIPLRRPEWCDKQHTAAFRVWFDSVVPLCDRIFSISRASADEVMDYVRLRGLALRDVIHPIPIGAGFAPSRVPGTEMDAKTVPGLPAPGSYVLFVSTIEARKNHALLFRVWRHLLEQMPEEKVPTLVFAGRIGWLVQDLMQQLRNADFLNGKIVLVEHPTDEALLALYRGCRFTLFPSFYEGWGLPVTESLAFGKPCVISNRTSLPEAGGTLARYFDPDDVKDALRVIRGIIEDPDGLAAWEARVVREFHPNSWEDSAHEVMRHLQPDRLAV